MYNMYMYSRTNVLRSYMCTCPMPEVSSIAYRTYVCTVTQYRKYHENIAVSRTLFSQSHREVYARCRGGAVQLYTYSCNTAAL